MWQKQVEIECHKNLNDFDLIKKINLTLSVFYWQKPTSVGFLFS